YCDTTYYPENMNISVINQPDSLGAACDFQPFSFYLGGHRAYVGLPNNPNYELGPDTNSFCDTVLSVNSTLPVIGKEELFAFYHPTWQTAFINAKGLLGKNYELQICDVLGKVIHRETGKLDSEFYSKDVSMLSFSCGLYIVSLLTEREKLVRRFVKE
ncbi:MAG: T9SS type A sorting domain-containing protein, partial [Bacteroidetes bacterium]|nr:T9SS type A sorting domain-containing protein [Bacteroidota bacterium]